MSGALRWTLAVLLWVGCGAHSSQPVPGDGGPEGGADADAALEPADAGNGNLVGWRLGAERAQFERGVRNAVLLDSGRIMVAGGNATMTVEEYDPRVDSWETVALLRPITPSNNTATGLTDGRVLVTGGGGGDGFLHPASAAHAETYLYDPVARAAPLTGALGQGRSHAAAVLLEDGRVLVTGGAGRTGGPADMMPVALAGCERFDPAVERWSPAGGLAVPRWAHTATRLADGRVLVAGGVDESGSPIALAELYDPSADAWSPAGRLAAGRSWHVAAALGSGRVLVAGGFIEGGAATAAAEIWDPVSGAFTDAAPLPQAVADAAVTVLDDHRVLVTGGVPDSTLTPVGQAAIFDDRTGRWTEMAPLVVPRFGHSAVRIEDGRVVVVLGRTSVTRADKRAEISEQPP